jgi:hypothetical protein
MKAYAYVNDDGSIEVDSVASSERAVMVNMIVISGRVAIWPTNEWSDRLIMAEFRVATHGKGSVKEVGVYVQPPFRDRDL